MTMLSTGDISMILRCQHEFLTTLGRAYNVICEPSQDLPESRCGVVLPIEELPHLGGGVWAGVGSSFRTWGAGRWRSPNPPIGFGWGARGIGWGMTGEGGRMARRLDGSGLWSGVIPTTLEPPETATT